MTVQNDKEKVQMEINALTQQYNLINQERDRLLTEIVKRQGILEYLIKLEQSSNNIADEKDLTKIIT